MPTQLLVFQDQVTIDRRARAVKVTMPPIEA
jgi:hypothetical protein